MTDLADPSKIIYKPAGYFMAPVEEERTGDVSNVLFSNGWITEEDGTVLIYYASSDTRQHVAVSTIERLLDYMVNTAGDGFRSATSVETLNRIIDKNLETGKETNGIDHSKKRVRARQKVK
jgi:4-O-beta-D-mannosyl-D-glucose phosphorylase